MTLLAWALWATVETASVPAVGAPLIQRDVIQSFETYDACDRAAIWAESQPDFREAWTIGPSGRKYRTTSTFECREGR